VNHRIFPPKEEYLPPEFDAILHRHRFLLHLKQNQHNHKRKKSQAGLVMSSSQATVPSVKEHRQHRRSKSRLSIDASLVKDVNLKSVNLDMALASEHHDHEAPARAMREVEVSNWEEHNLVHPKVHSTNGPYRHPWENNASSFTLTFITITAAVVASFPPPYSEAQKWALSVVVLFAPCLAFACALAYGVVKKFMKVHKKVVEHIRERRASIASLATADKAQPGEAASGEANDSDDSDSGSDFNLPVRGEETQAPGLARRTKSLRGLHSLAHPMGEPDATSTTAGTRVGKWPGSSTLLDLAHSTATHATEQKKKLKHHHVRSRTLALNSSRAETSHAALEGAISVAPLNYSLEEWAARENKRKAKKARIHTRRSRTRVNITTPGLWLQADESSSSESD